MRVLTTNEQMNLVAGGKFSIGGLGKAIGQGALSGVIGGTSTGAIKDRNPRKTGWGAVAGAVGGAIVGGVGYAIHH